MSNGQFMAFSAALPLNVDRGTRRGPDEALDGLVAMAPSAAVFQYLIDTAVHDEFRG